MASILDKWQLVDIIDLVLGVTLVLAWTIGVVAVAMDRKGNS